MKKIIELVVGIIVLAGLAIGLYYGYPALCDWQNRHGQILDKEAKMCAITVSADGRIVYILEPGRLIKSTDGGKTWKTIEVKVGE